MDIKRLVKEHRVKWLYDDCKSLDEMLKRLEGEIIFIEEAQDLNVKVSESKDGWCHLYCDVNSSNPISFFEGLEELGFRDEEKKCE